MAAAAAETEVGVADGVEAEAAEEEDEDGGGGGGDDDELDDTVGGVGVGDDGEAAVLLAAVEPEAAEGGAPGEAAGKGAGRSRIKPGTQRQGEMWTVAAFAQLKRTT